MNSVDFQIDLYKWEDTWSVSSSSFRRPSALNSSISRINMKMSSNFKLINLSSHWVSRSLISLCSRNIKNNGWRKYIRWGLNWRHGFRPRLPNIHSSLSLWRQISNHTLSALERLCNCGMSQLFTLGASYIRLRHSWTVPGTSIGSAGFLIYKLIIFSQISGRKWRVLIWNVYEQIPLSFSFFSFSISPLIYTFQNISPETEVATIFEYVSLFLHSHTWMNVYI